jgi:hypothetical protein
MSRTPAQIKLANLMHDTCNALARIDSYVWLYTKKTRSSEEPPTELETVFKKIDVERRAVLKLLDEYYTYQKAVNEQSAKEES